MPQRVWSGPHEKAELCYRQVTMIPTIWWKNNCRFFVFFWRGGGGDGGGGDGRGLNEDKSLNQMVWVHSDVCSLPLNRCTLSPGWVQGQHRQDSRSMSSARNSNLPGRAELSERCQTTDRLHFIATKRCLRGVRRVVQFSLRNNYTSLDSGFYLRPMRDLFHFCVDRIIWISFGISFPLSKDVFPTLVKAQRS